MLEKKSCLQGKKAKFALCMVAVFLAGYLTKSLTLKRPTAADNLHIVQPAAQKKWTCSMHPQIITDKPGNCPICEMKLVPVSVSPVSDLHAAELTISERAARLMEIETSLVERKFVTARIRLVGKIDFDETLVKNITAWVPGRIDRLYVDFTGTTVKKGDHLVYLYSPELITSQAELLHALKAVNNMTFETPEIVKSTAMTTLEAVREKLRLLGLMAEQIREIENSEKPVTHLTIYSPIGGVVIHKKAVEGMYVETGMHIYTVADLSRLWVRLDAYESDLIWIRYGQKIEFTTEAYPGVVFTGKISFISPILDEKTRTVKLRANVDNPEGKLKPQMFVRAIVFSQVARGGRVMAPEMADKWICPMHPDVVKPGAGKCDICGMDLVTTESLGYVEADIPKEAPLVIPASAPLITGKRAVVYVQLPNREVPTYQGREVVLGPRAGDYYIIESGLNEGEIVVTNGNFKIDSALQIQAKPSMMNPEGVKGRHSHHEHDH